jgi:thiol-disulfide isomerase/thioredoxin
LGGWILQLVKPKLNFSNGHIEWGIVLKALSRYWIASFGLITIQYFLCLLIKSFAWPMSIGLIAIIAGSIFAGFGVFTWFPYAATSLATFSGSQSGAYLLPHEKMSLLWTLLFLYLAYQYYRRKSFSKAFFSPVIQPVKAVAVLVLFAFLFWWINRPVVLRSYDRTVIAGIIKAEKLVNHIVVLQSPLYDTIASAAVVNGRFHLLLNQPIQPGVYYIRAGNYRASLFFGTNDSIHIDWTANARTNTIKFDGTRIAENEFLKKNNNFDYKYENLANSGYRYNANEFARETMEYWLDKKDDIHKFKTVDNIKPAADFISTQEKLLAVKALFLLEVQYPQTFSIYYPNSNLQYPKFVEKIRKELDLNNAALVGYEEYRSFISNYLHQKSPARDYNFFDYLGQQITSAPVRNVIIFDELQKRLTVTRDSSMREMLLSQTLPFITDSGFKRKLAEMNQRMNNLQRGKKAHNFLAEALNGNDFDLQRFLGRYVVIDLWATWCAPCQKESPYFDQLAEQYTGMQVAFISVSIDEDKNAWKVDAPTKSKKVLQLWAKNPEEDFNKYYAANFIPRFMLIDPKGNILNAQMPNPSDPEFEMILQKEIPFPGNY